MTQRQILSLEPKARIDAGDPLRLHPVAEALSLHLCAVLGQWQTTGARRDLRLGLFGRYGHGKSTVLNEIMERVARAYPVTRFIQFSCSRYRSDTIENELDRTLAQQLLKNGNFYNLFYLLFLVVLLIEMIFLLYGPVERLFGNVEYGPAMTFLVNVAIATGAWLSVTGSTMRTLLRDEENRLLRWLAGLSPPTVLIIDDLDRATVQQQRAILRALRVWTTGWQFPLVVAMDDTPLLTSAPDTEAPEELLNKIIDASYRLPDRISEDAARTVIASANELCKQAGGNWASDIGLWGDWTRVAVLMQRFEPRHIRRFLNDLLITVTIIGLDNPEEIAALTRLHAILILAPGLRDYSIALIEALASNDEAALLAAWKKASFSKAGSANEPVLLVVQRLFHATGHLQPPRRDWRRLVAHFVTESSSDRLLETQRRVGQGFPSAHWLGPDHAIATSQAPTSCATETTDQPGRCTETLDLHKNWPTIEAALAEAYNNAAHRLRILQDWQRQIASYPNDHRLRLLLLRVWLADAEVLELMLAHKRQELLSEALKLASSLDRHTLLLASPGRYFNIVDRIAIVTDGRFNSRDPRSITVWLADGFFDVFSLPHRPVLETISAADAATAGPVAIDHSWPPFRPDASDINAASVRAELTAHLTHLRNAYTYGFQVRPHSLNIGLHNNDWLLKQALAFPQATLGILGTLFDLDPESGAIRPGGAPWAKQGIASFEALLIDTPPDTSLNLIVRIAQPDQRVNRRGRDRWWLAFLLAVRYGDQALMERWARQWLPTSGAQPPAPPLSDQTLLERMLEVKGSALWRPEAFPRAASMALFQTFICKWQEDPAALDQTLEELKLRLGL